MIRDRPLSASGGGYGTPPHPPPHTPLSHPHLQTAS
jgi:hypothetical protein